MYKHCVYVSLYEFFFIFDHQAPKIYAKAHCGGIKNVAHSMYMNYWRGLGCERGLRTVTNLVARLFSVLHTRSDALQSKRPLPLDVNQVNSPIKTLRLGIIMSG